MIELNKIYHMDNREGLNLLPEKCANLIISDPPYFEVKGEFDFVWKDFDEYLRFMEQQAVLYKRILADNGTLFVYGHAKKIAYIQVIFDKYFFIVNNAVWDKGTFMGLEESLDIRSLAPCTERILVYGNYDDDNDNEIFAPVRNYLWNQYAKSGLTLKTANELMGMATTGANLAGEMFGKNRKRFAFPTKEKYSLLQKTGWFRKMYEELREEYDTLRRPYSNHFKLQEILKFSNEAMKTGSNYEHDTVKPEKLTRSLILTCSRKNDLVVVPFAGSGTECAMAAKEGRRFIGFDINPDYVVMANKRQNIESIKIQMF